MHGLLVVGRILPKHTFYVDFVEEVFSILSCEQHLVSIKHARSTEQRHQAWPATQGDTRLEFSPSEVPQYSLLLHHLELWRGLSSTELSNMGIKSRTELCGTAIDLLRHLLSTGLIVDMRPVFCWTRHCWGKAGKNDFEQLGILFPVLPLLTDMAALHQQSALVSQGLDGAVADLVPRGSLLHYVVMVLLSAISMERDLEDRKDAELVRYVRSALGQLLWR